MLRRLVGDPVTRRLLLGYAIIGAIVFVFDFGVFQIAIVRGLSAVFASTISYYTGAVVHFLLNKYGNFRNYDRAMHQQARTYLVIIVTQWLATMVIVGLCVAHGVAPLLARLAAVILTLPVGFVAHRYLTFGAGILATVTRLRRASK